MAREVEADLESLFYGDLETAAAYAENRVGGAVWLALDEAAQTATLVTASRELDTLDWIGERASDDDQELEWPRTGTDYSDDAWPEKLVHATIELAISYAPAFADGYSGPDVLSGQSANGNVKSETIGPISLTYFDPTTTTSAADVSRFPLMVQRLVAGLLYVASGWGSAEVLRSS